MLNKATVYDRYPLPRHKDLLNRLETAYNFSSLDLRSGCWQICIVDCDVHKTAFWLHSRLFEWDVVLFGLTNTPGIFMHIMNQLLEDLLNQGALIFLEYILIYSITI